jgi:hypothetical protein
MPARMRAAPGMLLASSAQQQRPQIERGAAPVAGQVALHVRGGRQRSGAVPRERGERARLGRRGSACRDAGSPGRTSGPPPESPACAATLHIRGASDGAAGGGEGAEGDPQKSAHGVSSFAPGGRAGCGGRRAHARGRTAAHHRRRPRRRCRRRAASSRLRSSASCAARRPPRRAFLASPRSRGWGRDGELRLLRQLQRRGRALPAEGASPAQDLGGVPAAKRLMQGGPGHGVRGARVRKRFPSSSPSGSSSS